MEFGVESVFLVKGCSLEKKITIFAAMIFAKQIVTFVATCFVSRASVSSYMQKTGNFQRKQVSKTPSSQQWVGGG